MYEPKVTTQNSLKICQVLAYSLHKQEAEGSCKE